MQLFFLVISRNKKIVVADATTKISGKLPIGGSTAWYRRIGYGYYPYGAHYVFAAGS